MPVFFRVALCITLCLSVRCVSGEELSREVVLTIDGKEHAVPDGGAIEVDGLKIMAVISPRQTFTGNGYRLSLPGHFALEKDESEPSAISYTFDGKNVVVTIYELSDQVDAGSFVGQLAQGMKEALSVDDLKKAKADPLVLEDATIPGEMITMKVGVAEIRFSLFVIDRAGGKSVLTLQSGVDRVDLDELAEVKAALAKSYRKHP